MTRLDHDRLERVLVSIGDDLAVSAPAPLASPTWRAPILRWVASMVVVVVVVGLVIAPVRETVADWLGIGSTELEIDRSSAGAPESALPSIAVGLDRLTAGEAATLLGRPLAALDATALGGPSGLARMPEGGVLVVWSDATTLWIRRRETEPSQTMRKMIDSVEQAFPVRDLGEDALAVTGDHMLLTPHRRVSAGNVVMWLRAGLELRLEGDRPIDELIEIARRLDAAGVVE